ncbi:hypothetical protein [Streptomyces sp. NPDC058280]|uniref:hypothetical protein n=1 Tax=Streptomyces sp. NPDC058280 TaxID=3346419 RepID=UPI0036EBB82A
MTDDESALRARLHRIIDGPPVTQELPPLVEVHVIPEPAPAAEEDEDNDQEDDGQEDEEQPEKDRWWYVLPGPFGRRPPDPELPPQGRLAAAPGIHVTVNQPPAPWAPSIDPDEAARVERRHRRRVWLAVHGAAAGVGWFVGLPQVLRGAMVSAGHQGAGLGIGFCLVGYIVASYLPGLPYIPPPLRPVIVWAARIPIASAALALALYAPGAV